MNILTILIKIIKELVLGVVVLSKKLEMICMLNLRDFLFLFCILIVKEKIKYLTILMLPHFFSLKNLISKMSEETYGSANLCIESIEDRVGRKVKKDTLFYNLYDYWTSYHDPNKKIFWWYDQKLWRLEMCIRRKWNRKILPLVNIIIKKYKENDEFFNPTQFLNELDSEKYFELLAAWKKEVEASYLKDFPYFRFGPHRHKKTSMKPRTCIR